MSDRDRNPPEAAIVERLRNEETTSGTEPVMALVGYVGPGRLPPPEEPGGDPRPEEDRDVRLYPDLDLQRWMDFPRGDIVDSRPVDPDDTGRVGRNPVGGRHVVWVKLENMFDPVFGGDSAPNVDDHFAGSAMSTWPLFPATRYVAAQLLDLVPSPYESPGD